MNNYIFNYDLLIWLGLIITVLAQTFITSSYRKYRNIENSKNNSGFDVARKILDKNNLKDIMIIETRGSLTDHYDPTSKVVRLSTDIYHGTSIAAAAVAAHECGHAIQDKVDYKPMKIRSKLVPIVNLCTRLGYFAIAIGAFFSYILMEVGVILLLSMLLFQLVTLPVEFNASKRALKELENYNLLSKDEKHYAKNMLIAAALTYVASIITTLMQLLRYFLIANSRRR